VSYRLITVPPIVPNKVPTIIQSNRINHTYNAIARTQSCGTTTLFQSSSTLEADALGTRLLLSSAIVGETLHLCSESVVFDPFEVYYLHNFSPLLLLWRGKSEIWDASCHVPIPYSTPTLETEQTHISELCKLPPQFLSQDWVCVGRVIVQNETACADHVSHRCAHFAHVPAVGQP